MGILTVEQLASAIGTTFTTEKAQSAQFYIDVVSSYLETETGVSFFKITGETIRMESDARGRVELTMEPIQDVTSVVDFETQVELTPITEYKWNGLNTLKLFRPFRTFDITLDYGYDPCPMDIVGVCVEAVRRGLATGNIPYKQQTVGDVTVIYGDLLTFSKSDLEIIGRYGQQETTWGPTDDSPYETRFYSFDSRYTTNGPDC